MHRGRAAGHDTLVDVNARASGQDDRPGRIWIWRAVLARQGMKLRNIQQRCRGFGWHQFQNRKNRETAGAICKAGQLRNAFITSAILAGTGLGHVRGGHIHDIRCRHSRVHIHRHKTVRDDAEAEEHRDRQCYVTTSGPDRHACRIVLENCRHKHKFVSRSFAVAARTLEPLKFRPSGFAADLAHRPGDRRRCAGVDDLAFALRRRQRRRDRDIAAQQRAARV